MIAVWESDISAIFLIICLKLLTDTAFFRHLGKLFHNIALAVREAFVSNSWRLVWVASAFPQSLSSYKQSDAGRKAFEDNLGQVHS